MSVREMTTYSGAVVDPLADDFVPDIEDIAHALSMICRYNGHTSRFYSVAEHSVLVARWVGGQYRTPRLRRRAMRTAILHDGTEAFLGDQARPIKWRLDGYAEMERRVDARICVTFAVAPWCQHLHGADDRIIVDEMTQLMKGPLHPSLAEMQPLGVTLPCWSPAEAKAAFLSLWHELEGDLP